MGDASALQRSYLYVPAHKPALFAKAIAGPSDALVLDLEDGVPPAEKAPARRGAAAVLGTAPDRAEFVEDVLAVPSRTLAGVRLPKAERPLELRRLAGLLGVAGVGE